MNMLLAWCIRTTLQQQTTKGGLLATVPLAMLPAVALTLTTEDSKRPLHPVIVSRP